ncbi:MAG: bifunctional indole-3-glycerol phosphate synthase/phosphoribosylanthranilate isomerase [Spirochaetales bacterium]|nr:bifunctional indole-3-glycerol phosphate synthase/phosphoribosylanthranilate isomerase [Spirochaetales bacterium]
MRLDQQPGSGPVTDIKAQIVARRRSRMAREGHTLGSNVPEKRRVPLVPFLEGPGVICEIKRKSPSKGEISMTLDPVAQAARYAAAGVRSVSVLTEEDYFAGSLTDLMAVKNAHPGLSVLRKDFLVDEEDIEVSYRAGADAVLLIASMLSSQTLAALYRKASSLGLSVLFELHDEEDIKKAAFVQPRIIGINCRNLATFSTDLVYPLKVRARLAAEGIPWDKLVFESGIFCEEDASYAFDAGFSAVLVGEGVVRNPGLIPELINAAAYRSRPSGEAGFWGRLYEKRFGVKGSLGPSPQVPLVKVCGLTRPEDALLAADLGADILGFIFAPSPRRTSGEAVRRIHAALYEAGREIMPLMAAVVVTGTAECPSLPEEVTALLEEGLIDGVQFHGNEKPEDCFSAAFPYYKALRIGSARDLELVREYRSPRVLIDAFSLEGYGGTGKRIDSSLVEQARHIAPLWLAGGLNPENIAGTAEDFLPELVDVSSGLESSPGIKSAEKMRAFFNALSQCF